MTDLPHAPLEYLRLCPVRVVHRSNVARQISRCFTGGENGRSDLLVDAGQLAFRLADKVSFL